jgi:hypothetical protein
MIRLMSERERISVHHYMDCSIAFRYNRSHGIGILDLKEYVEFCVSND